MPGSRWKAPAKWWKCAGNWASVSGRSMNGNERGARWVQRTERTAGAPRREPAAQAAGRRLDVGQAHPAGGGHKKSRKPARRREVAVDLRDLCGEDFATMHADPPAAIGVLL